MGSEHSQIQELLPWYVNETLSGKDKDLVLRHLGDCKACQEERDSLYKLQTVIAESESVHPGYELSYRRVLKRIEESERNKESTREIETTPVVRRLLPFGIAASLVTILLAGAAWLGNDGGQPIVDEYQTLSSDLPGRGISLTLELGFINPIPAATMRQALIETSSNIVSGPDEHGNYLVEVRVPDTMTDAQYLAQIREIDGVEHARLSQD
jgi:hypothetical protein